MGAGNRDALLDAHQFGQHLRPRHDRHVPQSRHHDFRVVVTHRRRYHHGIGRCGVLRAVADRDAYALRRQTPRRGTFGEIGTADRIALIRQYLGDARHAGTADADEMDAFDFVFHAE